MSTSRNPFAHLRCAALSDVGRKRKNNEDAAAAFPSRGVWCVADGMGGGDDGEVASGAVVRAVDACLSDMPVPDDGCYSADAVVRLLAHAVDGASAWISDRAVKKGLDGCGSTVVGVAFDPTCPGTAIAFHVGDSRLYRLRGRDIRQITKDHSVEEMMGAKDGKSLNPMFRGMILRAVGIERTVEIETTKFPVHEGDIVLLCSDGLSRMLKDKQIVDIVREADGDMGTAASRLVAAANEAGGIDNITVILVHVGALPPATPAAMLPDSVELSSTQTTGSNFVRDDEGNVIRLLRRYGWLVVALALGGVGVAYLMAISSEERRVPPQPAVPVSRPPTPVAVPPPVRDPLLSADVATNVLSGRVAETSIIANAERDVQSVALPPKVRESAVSQTQEDRERQEVLAQLKAERAQRAREEADAASREVERLSVARELGAYYYRDEFSAFARVAKDMLGDDAVGRLQTLGRSLHLCRNQEAVGELALEFVTEARSLAARMVAASSEKACDANVAELCRAIADGDPAAVSTQRKFLDLLKLFSVQGVEENGRTR